MTQSSIAPVPIVLDASALLAVIQVEPGWERVSAAIEAKLAIVCAVNWSETIAKLAARMSDAEIVGAMGKIRVPVKPFSDEDAWRAGLMIRSTRVGGLSFGDRACVALAQRLSALVLTADRAWARVDLGIAIEKIR